MQKSIPNSLNSPNSPNLFFILICLCGFFTPLFAEEPLFQEIGHRFLDGIIKANYRETPIDEVFLLQQVSLPSIHCPHSVEHPTLLFSKTQASQIYHRQWHQPYRTWADQIIQAAQHSRDPTSPLLTELERGKIAKLNAFAYFLAGNDLFRESARQALLSIKDAEVIKTIEGGETNVGWGDWIQAADALRQYAVAYDLIASELSPVEREWIENRLADEVQQIVKYFILIPKNNHAICIAIGVATVALTIDDPRNQEWLDQAMAQIRGGLALIEPDGSYREGGYYARYVAQRLFPFTFYLYNVTGVNLFEHPRLYRFNRWLIDLEKPNGQLPLFDDAFPEDYLYQPIGVGLAPESGELRYIFSQNSDRYDVNDANWVEAYCTFDDHVQSRVPDYPSATFYPDGGMTIFRHDQEIYGFLLSEPGRPHISGHDHIEPTGFMLSAFDQDLLIEGGYGPGGVSDPDRAWYLSGQAHNMPRVNGLTANQNYVWGDDLSGTLTNYFETKAFSAATVKTRYRETEICRRVWFVEQQFFVVVDDLVADEPKQFSIPWHALGDFQQINPQRVRWHSSDTFLTAEFLAPKSESIRVTSQIGKHTLLDQNGIHTTAIIELPLSSQQQLTSILIPHQSIIAIETVPILSHTNTSARQIGRNLIVTAQGAWQTEHIASDAKTALFHQSEMGQIDFFQVVAAHYVKIDGDYIFCSDQPIDLMLVLADHGWYGYLGETTEVELQFFPSMDPGEVVLDQTLIETTWQDQTLTLKTNHGGILNMGCLNPPIHTTRPVKDSEPLLERLSHYQQQSQLMETLTFAEKMQLRNEIIQVTSKRSLDYADSILFPGSQTIPKIYGIGGGILNSMYNAAGVAKINIPQLFELERVWYDYHIHYYEEGFLVKNGIKTLRHQLSIRKGNQVIGWKYDRLFKLHEYHQLYIHYRKSILQVQLDKWRENYGYGVYFDQRFVNGRVGLHYLTAVDGHQVQTLSAGYGRWSGEITTRNKPQTGRFNVNYHSSNLSSVLTMRTDRDGLNNLNLHNLLVITNNTKLRHQLVSQGPLKWNTSATLFLSRDRTKGRVSVEKDTTGNVSGVWHSFYQYQDWRIESRGRYGNILTGDFGLGRRRWQVWMKRGKFVSCNAVWPPLTGRMEWGLSDAELREGSVGLFHLRWGGEICFLQETEQLIGIMVIMRLPMIHYHSTIFFEENGGVERYEITVHQPASPTPGILFSQDRRGFKRFEGYVRFNF